MITKPGYTLIHHDKQWWDPIMEFGEWDGSPGQDLKATHVDGVIAWPQLAKMNPAVSCLYSGLTLDMSTITVLKIKPFVVPGHGLIDPHDDPIFAEQLASEVKAHLGEPYDWMQIARFAGIGIEARLDPVGAREALAKADPADVQRGHYGVCSVWWEVRLENAITATYNVAVNLAAGSPVGQFDAPPADWEQFVTMEKVIE